MTTSDLLQARLFNQNLVSPQFMKPVQVVKWFGAIQSQDYPGAKWALSLRTNTSDKEIEQAFNKGEILRTHMLRPTWHFVASEDILWMLDLTKTKVKRMMGTYNKVLGLNDEIFAKAERIIQKELSNNNYLTRFEIGTLLKKNGVSWKGNGLAHLVMNVELNGIICSGPKKAKQHTYGLISELAPGAKSKSHEQALKELTKRYFQSHGPALIIDFNWWSGLSIKDIKLGIEMNPEIKHEEIQGKTYYFFEANSKKASDKIYLLPNYDEYTVAYKDRTALVENVDKAKLDFRQNSLFNNVIIIDGKIEGVWRRTLKTKEIIIETRLFKTLNIEEKKELQKALENYAKFIGLELKNI